MITLCNSLQKVQAKTGGSLRANLYKGSVVRQGIKSTHKRSRVESRFSGPSKFQGSVSKPNSVDFNRTVVAYTNQQAGTHSAEICTLLL